MRKDIVVGAQRWMKRVLVMVALGAGLSLTAVHASAANEPGPCAVDAQSRQMDYWLGDWTVTYPGAPGGSTSKVHLDLDKCLIVETWDGGKGHSGQNTFAYSADDKNWHGMFADNKGRVHVFEGKVASGVAEFTGPSRNTDGEAVLNRVKVVRMDADKVEQSWEKSTDNGVTWKTEFRGEYLRTKR